MIWSYEPLSERECEQARSFPLLDPGVYEFEVKSAIAKPSKSGNPMIELQLEIYDTEGKQHVIYDYLVSTKQMQWKIRHFCSSIGLTAQYEDGSFNDKMCPGRMGKASVVYQPGNKKPDGSYYKDKNSIEDYVSKESEMTKLNGSEIPVNENNFQDSDLPF